MLETEAPKTTVETKAVAVPKPTEQATAAGEPQPTLEAKAVEAPQSAGDGKEAHGETIAEERELEPVEAADEDSDVELENIGVEEGGVDAEHGCDKSEQDDVDAEQFWQEAFDEEERAWQLSQESSLLADYEALKEKRKSCWLKEQHWPSQRVESKLC